MISGRWSLIPTKDRWLAAALFAVLTLVLTYPLSLSPGTTSLGSDPDVHLFTWILAWDAHALVTRPWAIFDANIFFPYERTLAFSENLIGSGVLAAPVLWVTGNPVLAMNVVSLLSCVLCGVGAYVLGRRIGVGIAAALLCGLIFAFSPARFFRFQQIHLTTIQWIPLTLAFLHTYLETGRKRDLRLAAGLFTLQAFTSLHGGVFLAIAIAALVLQRLAAGQPLDAARRVRDLGAVGVLLLAPTALLVPPYVAVQKEMGLVRTLDDWAPAPASFLASPTTVHTWLHAQLGNPSLNERASAFLFPGYLPLALAFVALLLLVVSRRRLARRSLANDQPDRSGQGEGGFRRETVFFGALTLLAVLLSVGPPLGLWPFVYWLPVLNFIRIPSRFFLLAVLGIAVLAGIGFERLTARALSRTRIAAALAVGLGLLAEFAWLPLPVTPYRVELPALDRWLDTQPKPFAVAEVPVGPFARYHSTYMLHSMAHWQKTVHGHSGLLPALHEELYADLRNFPDDASVRKLAEVGVDYVVVHTDMYAPGEWDEVQKRLEQYRPLLTLHHADTSGRVYRLSRRSSASEVRERRRAIAIP